MTRALLQALASPRFLLGLALLGAVVLLCLAACGPGADRTPKMNATIHAPFNSRIGSPFASNYKTGVKVGFTDDGLLLITATQKGPIKEFSFDGGKWCDVYADARGLHWKDCKTGEEFPRRLESTLIFTLLDIAPRLDRIEARLKKLEGHAKAPLGNDTRTTPPGLLPEPTAPCWTSDLDGTNTVFMPCINNMLMPTAPWPGDKAPEPADHMREMPGQKGGKP